MNPIIEKLRQTLSEIEQLMSEEDNIDMYLREREEQLYWKVAVDDEVIATIRVFCRNDKEKEFSMEVYGLGRVVSNREMALWEINRQNLKMRWFKLCLNQNQELLLRRDGEYKNDIYRILHDTEYALDIMKDMIPCLKPYVK